MVQRTPARWTRLIITGANGSGKSRLAGRIATLRPDLPVVHYDRLRLTRNWIKKDPTVIAAALSDAVGQERWILEGGPSVLGLALPVCDGVIWLDSPARVRARRLALRPWASFGRARPDVPPGNRDWPIQQYRFAMHSLRKGASFRRTIATALEAYPAVQVWRCRSSVAIEGTVAAIAADAPTPPRTHPD